VQHNPNFFLKYMDIRVGPPQIDEGMVESKGMMGGACTSCAVCVAGVDVPRLLCAVTPHACRLRDLTYSGKIYVDVKYVLDRRIMMQKDVVIGTMPLMLRSSKCVLRGKSLAEMAKVWLCIERRAGCWRDCLP
jgi:DNA-directed RNA polymerase III subunit RPC2